MSASDGVAIGVASVGVAVLVAATIYAVVPHTGAARTALLRDRGVLLNRNVTDLRPQLAEHTREWHPLPAPPGAREVPLLPSGPRTPFPGAVNRRTLPTNREAFRAFLRWARGVLRAAGRSDEDVRCTVWLWLKETAWGYSCYGSNTGNRKATASTYSSPADIIAGRCWTTRAGATAVYPLIDGLDSLDVYNTFGSFEDSARDELALFNWSNYRGVLEGYRAGELEGLIAAQTAMNHGGYSGGVLSTQLTDCRFYWSLGARLAGEEWVR